MVQETNTTYNLPKLIELHIHLDGAISLSTAKKLLAINGRTVPDDDTLKNRIQIQSACASLSEFLEKFNFLYPLIQTREALTLITSSLLRELSKEGVIYAEIRFAPLLCCQKGLRQEEVLQAVLKGMKDSPVRCNLVLCMMREASKEANLETIRLVRQHLGKGVAALDLAGAEDRYDDKLYDDLLRTARENALPLTIHAGEAGGADHVRRALEWGARVIGHGVRSYEDPAVEDYLATHKIPLTMCPTSNVLTGVVSRIEDLPIRRYMEKGIPVTINTDDPGVEGTTLRQEWEKIIQAFDLTPQEIRTLMLNSTMAAFCQDEDRVWLRKEIEKAYPV